MRQNRGSGDGQAETQGLRMAQAKEQGSGTEAWVGNMLTSVDKTAACRAAFRSSKMGLQTQ